MGRRTKEFNSPVFSGYIEGNNLINRKPYTAVKRISKATAWGKDDILSAIEMDSIYKDKKNNQVYLDSIGASFNLGINELADVLFRFENKKDSY